MQKERKNEKTFFHSTAHMQTKKKENVCWKKYEWKKLLFFFIIILQQKNVWDFWFCFFLSPSAWNTWGTKKKLFRKSWAKSFFFFASFRGKKAKQWRSIQNKNVFLGKSQGLLPRPGKLFPWPYKTFENNVTVLVFVWFLHRLEKKKRFEKLEEWKEKKKSFFKSIIQEAQKKNFQDQKTSLVKQKQTKNESWTHLCARRPNVLS